MKYGPTFFPTYRDIEIFHNIVITQRGEHGYVSKGLVKGALEWAMTDVYNYVPFPSLLMKGAALMYAYTCFHPYADGNKRTALMATAFFLDLNACQFDIPSDAPEFAKELAIRTIDTSEHDPTFEIERVSHWLRTHIRRPFSRRVNYARRARKAINQGLLGDVYVDSELGSLGDTLLWGISQAEKIRKFLPGHSTALSPSSTLLHRLLRENH